MPIAPRVIITINPSTTLNRNFARMICATGSGVAACRRSMPLFFSSNRSPIEREAVNSSAITVVMIRM